MTRLTVGIACAVIASGVTAIANDMNVLGFVQWNAGQSPSAPLDIRPSGITSVPPLIRGRLKCAENVNHYLRSAGYRGTGSARARDFLAYGRPVSGPQPGAIQVERRGRNPNAGHVQIVSHKVDGVWMCRNPSSRVGAWTTNPCSNPRVLAYRMPTGAESVPQRMYASNSAKPRQTAFPRAVSAYAPPVGTFGPAIVPASFGAMQAYAVIQ